MDEQRWLFPRLPRGVAEALVDEMKVSSPKQRRVACSLSHPRAAPAPTGGTPIPESALIRLSEDFRAEFSEDLSKPLSSGREAEVDARFGRVLHSRMHIISSDAASEGVWSFLSLVVFPDIATWRFPDCHPARLIGTPRNVFRRPWWRQHILGDVMNATHESPLGEDELVGIFERSRMARSHELAKALAREIMHTDISARSHFARELAKRVRRALAYVNPDVLDRSQIQGLVHAAAKQALEAHSHVQ